MNRRFTRITTHKPVEMLRAWAGARAGAGENQSIRRFIRDHEENESSYQVPVSPL